ncbi:MAG: tetratricopeptide repeat protein [Verrucomicrobiota bacterium]
MKMFPFDPRPLLLATAVCVSALGLQAQDDAQRPATSPATYLAEHEKEIQIRLRGRGAPQTLLITDMEAGSDGNELVMRPIGTDTDQRVYLPLNQLEGLSLSYNQPEGIEAAKAAAGDLQRGEFQAAAEKLRPVAWSLVPYAMVPEKSFPIHNVLRMFFSALVQSEQYDEAVAFARMLPLNSSYPVLSRTALQLSERLFAEGRLDDGFRIVNLLPVEPGNYQLLETLMNFANRVREGGNIEEAFNIYRRIIGAGESTFTKEAQLWSAYCSVRNGRIESARIFIQQAGALDKRDTLFSLAQMVKGLVHLQSEDYQSAMDEVSQGVVFARIGYRWAPELLYTSALCYNELDRPETARNIYEQILLFYPNSVWADRSKAAIKQLDA